MVKETNIVLRVDESTKKIFQKMAEARNISLTSLILGLISDGARIELERRERVRKIGSKLLK